MRIELKLLLTTRRQILALGEPCNERCFDFEIDPSRDEFCLVLTWQSNRSLPPKSYLIVPELRNFDANTNTPVIWAAVVEQW